MKAIHCAWAAALLVSLAMSSCAKDSIGVGGKGTTESYNKKIDSYLAERYLWNDEYGQTTRDLTVEYDSDEDNFLTVTLMKMSTNTLDKKPSASGGTPYYRLYSYITRTARSRAAMGLNARGVNHSVKKKQEYSLGFARLGMVRFTNTNKVGFYVMAVYLGSPAEKAGFRRGTIFTEIDGKMITDAENDYNPVYKRLTSPSEALSVTFKDRRTDEETTLKAELIYPNPVLRAEVINQDEHKIGYLVYNSFDAAYDDDLLDSLRKFRDAGITDLVLDLRYNGGGHVISSKMLATCIAGEKCRGKVFQYYRYNDDRMANPAVTQKQTGNTYDAGKKLFHENFSYDNYYGVNLAQYALDLPRLYVLTTHSTASSSEAVINGLRGIDIPVTLIGERTNGKNVGMEVDKFDEGDYSYEVTPITFQGYNAQETTVDPAGLAVNYTVADWNNRVTDFGPEEPLLAKALSLITGRTYAPSPERSAAGITPIEGIAPPDDPRRPAGMLALPPQEGE